MNDPTSRSAQKRKLDILVVENDPAAVLLTKEAFREAGLADCVHSVPDGDEALAYLRREGKYKDRPHADLIMLDLHLPKRSGLEVLKELKDSSEFTATPVIVVSGSDNPREVRKAYELHASCFIRKPDDLYEFLEFIKICFDFWGAVVTLPERPEFVGSLR